jgi:hypothetical protein
MPSGEMERGESNYFTKNSSRPQRNGERAAAVLTDSFGGRGGDEGRSATEKHGGSAWSSVS